MVPGSKGGEMAGSRKETLDESRLGGILCDGRRGAPPSLRLDLILPSGVLLRECCRREAGCGGEASRL